METIEPVKASYNKRCLVFPTEVLLYGGCDLPRFGCLQGIADEFDVSTSIAGLVITVFLIGYCAGPLFFAPLSKFYGRRIIFLITFTGYFVFNFLCAFAPNLGALLTGRLVYRIFASTPLTNAAGLMSNIWNPIQRGNAMAVFAMMIVIGPALGPRWKCMVFTILETLPSRILVNKLRKPKNEGAIRDIELEYLARMDEKSLLSSFKETLYRPWVIMLDLITSLVAVYTSLVTAIGGWLGGLIIFYFSAREKARLQSGARLTLEDCLPATIIGGIGFCATMFWFSWSAASLGTHWMVPTLAGTFLSTSMGLIFVLNLNYLLDTYPLYGTYIRGKSKFASTQVKPS
ncbi:major facilitator superfamily domain-containing protein [Aspergillus carlsbadensis]|nr:major facilitator superfamily domain-containing protein [Aspergillus carlsbadensis]